MKRQSYTEKGRGSKRDFPPLVHIPTEHNSQVWVFAKARSFMWVSSIGGRESSTQITSSCFFRHISKKLDWKWSIWDKLELSGMLASQSKLNLLCHNASPH